MPHETVTYRIEVYEGKGKFARWSYCADKTDEKSARDCASMHRMRGYEARVVEIRSRILP